MIMLTSEQFGGVLRAVLAFVAGYLPTTFDAGLKEQVIAGVVLIGVALWSWYTNKPANIPANTPPTV